MSLQNSRITAAAKNTAFMLLAFFFCGSGVVMVFETITLVTKVFAWQLASIQWSHLAASIIACAVSGFILITICLSRDPNFTLYEIAGPD